MVDKRIYLSTNYIFGTFFGRNWENSLYLSSTETEIERFGEFQKLRFFLCIGGTLFRWTHGVLRVLILEWVSISAMVKMLEKNNLYSKEGLKMQDMHQKNAKRYGSQQKIISKCIKMEMFGTFCPPKREP